MWEEVERGSRCERTENLRGSEPMNRGQGARPRLLLSSSGPWRVQDRGCGLCDDNREVSEGRAVVKNLVAVSDDHVQCWIYTVFR